MFSFSRASVLVWNLRTRIHLVDPRPAHKLPRIQSSSTRNTRNTGQLRLHPSYCSVFTTSAYLFTTYVPNMDPFILFLPLSRYQYAQAIV